MREFKHVRILFSIALPAVLAGALAAQSTTPPAIQSLTFERALNANQVLTTLTPNLPPVVAAGLLAGALELRESIAFNPINQVLSFSAFVVQAGAPLPTFDRGYLIFLNPWTPVVDVFGPNGVLLHSTAVSAPHAISTPNAPQVYVHGAAIDEDGTLAVALAYTSALNPVAGRPPIYSGGIAFLDRTGRQTRFIDTGVYETSGLCFAPDHSLWTFGWQRDAEKKGELLTDYLMFRKYSPEGTQVGAYVSRSLFPAGLPPGSGFRGLWSLRIANDRIGARAYSGNDGRKLEWIELDLEGHLLGHWPLGPSRYTLGYTSDHTLYGSGWDIELQKIRLSVFNRKTSSWDSKEILDAAYPDHDDGVNILLGADADGLVFSGKDNGRGVPLKWFSAPK